jgi:hypothetical protein
VWATGSESLICGSPESSDTEKVMAMVEEEVKKKRKTKEECVGKE